jgi:hypothetical protein
MKNKLKIQWSHTNTSKKSLKIERKLDIFDFGFMLIHCTLGGLELYDIQNHVCEHHNEELISTCCCFFHCLCVEKKPPSKLSFRKFINSINYSDQYNDFLCLCTSYKHTTSNSIQNLKIHPWLQQENKNRVGISLNEILNVSRDFNLKNEYLNNNKSNSEQRFEKLLDNLALVLPTCQCYFNHQLTQFNEINQHKKESFRQIFDNSITVENLKELHKEYGIKEETIKNKIESVFESVFFSFLNKNN